MLEKILELDKELLIFLNGLGSSTFDGMWLIITKQAYWAPLFLIVFYLLQKKLFLSTEWFYYKINSRKILEFASRYMPKARHL